MQKEIAEKAGISGAMLSMILHFGKRPTWSTAKRLAAATGTDPVLWRTPNEIKQAITEESDTLMKN